MPQKPVKAKGEGEEAGPPLLLAESWDNAADLSGWWMSEKLDGVRAYWDGKQFMSRQGNLYHAPDWFIEGLPDVPLDGELWLDRKKFQRTVSIVRRQDKSDLWKEMRIPRLRCPGSQRSRSKNGCNAITQIAWPSKAAAVRRSRTSMSCARASIICARNWPGSKRSAAKG